MSQLHLFLLFLFLVAICIWIDGYIAAMVVMFVVAWLYWATPVGILMLLGGCYLAIRIGGSFLADLEFKRYMEKQEKRAYQFAEAFAMQNVESLQFRKAGQQGVAGGLPSRAWDLELGRIFRVMWHNDALFVCAEPAIRAAIEKVVGQFPSPGVPGVDAIQSDVAYIQHCSEELGKAGWVVAELVEDPHPDYPVIAASKNGQTLVLGCLSRDAAVPDSVVGEMRDLKGRHGADASGIVTNRTYTEAAHMLSRRTGVFLLHQTELATFSSVKGG